MFEYGWYIVAVVVLGFLVREGVREYRRIMRKPKRVLIKERLIKILFNPFDNQMWWTKFNPKSRTWEWVRVASEAEVLSYNTTILSEEIGDKILALGENKDDRSN